MATLNPNHGTKTMTQEMTKKQVEARVRKYLKKHGARYSEQSMAWVIDTRTLGFTSREEIDFYLPWVLELGAIGLKAVVVLAGLQEAMKQDRVTTALKLMTLDMGDSLARVRAWFEKDPEGAEAEYTSLASYEDNQWDTICGKVADFGTPDVADWGGLFDCTMEHLSSSFWLNDYDALAAELGIERWWLL